VEYFIDLGLTSPKTARTITLYKKIHVGGAIENFVITVIVMNWNFCTQNSSVVKPRQYFCSVYKKVSWVYFNM